MRLRTRPIAAVADGVVGGGVVEPRLELPLGVSGEGGDQLDDAGPGAVGHPVGATAPKAKVARSAQGHGVTEADWRADEPDHAR